MFESAGELSRREVVFRWLRDKPTDVVIPYGDMPYEQDVMYQLREAVARTLERELQRTVVGVRGQGWKVVLGVAQVEAATRKRRQATKRLGRAVQIIETVDRREMSAQERVRADQELITATTGYGVLRGLAIKAPRIGVDDIVKWQREREG